MALFLKSRKPSTSSASEASGLPIVEQWIKVSQKTALGAGVALPASTTGQLFRVRGGKVLVRALIGTVTTVIQNSDPVLSILSKQLDNSSAAVGTAVTIASTAALTSLEVGGTVFVEGDGTAIVLANAGCTLMGTNTGMWVAPQGEIYLNTTATKTGALIWDLWYQPLDATAFVTAAPLTAGVLTAAI